MPPIHCIVDVGPVRVAVRTDEQFLLDYLADFYEIADVAGAGGVSWTVDAALGSGSGLPPLNRWGVAYQADRGSRAVVVRSQNLTSLAITTRKIIREALVEHCERRRFAMVHASAFWRDDHVVIVVGDKGSGKTTLALRAVLDHEYRLLSNDHLIVFAEPGPQSLPDVLRLTSLPTPIPVKVGTYLDLEERLPQPWDDEGLDLDRFRLMLPVQRYASADDRVMFTYRGLGQDHPVELSLGPAGTGPDVIVVLATYAAPGEAAGRPVPIDDPEAALWPHVRFDWVFDPDLNTQHLPRRQRTREVYGTDARQHLMALTDRAEVITWAHCGDPGPLLETMERRRSRPCIR